MKLTAFLASGLILINHLHAQDGTVTDTNIDWNSLSDFDVELKAVEAMPTISAADLAASGLQGTFYSAQHISDWPPIPGDWLSLPVWEIDTNLFLINDLNYSYQTQSATTSSGLHALDESGGGFTPDFNISSNGLWLQINGVSNGFVNLILYGTTNGVEYEILSQPALGDGTNVADWNSEGLFWGSSATNWTATTVAQNDRTNLFFSARSWQDSTGTGIPNWWWLAYFGQDTNVDAYADPDGDGWNNLQEFQNGTSPTAFDTPPAPQGLAVSFDSASSTADVSWQPSPSPVTGYTVNSYDEWTGQTTNFNFSASADSFSDAVSDSSDEKTIFGSDSGPTIAVEYQIQAHYPGGDSAWSDPVLLEPNYTSPYNLQATLPVSLIAGPQGSAYLAASGLPAGTVTLRVKLVDEYAETFYGDASFDTTVDIPISALTNGLYLLPTALTAPPTDSYGQSEYVWYVQTVDAADNPSEPMPLNIVYSSRAVPSYFDGRTQLKQNLTFLLRAPNATAPFQFVELHTNEDYSIITTSSNYVYADLNDAFANNYLYRNFVFSTTNVDSDGAMTTGVSMYDYDGYPFDEDEGVLLLLEPWSYQFQPPSTNDVTIASLLATDQTRWLCAAPLSLLGGGGSSEIGFSSTTDTPPIWTLSGSARNYWGLPYLSAELAYGSGGSLATATLSAGNSIQLAGANVYMEAAQPQFQMVEYDFWSGSSVYGSWSGSPLPGMANFSTSQTSDFLITAVGNPNFQVASYAKLAVTNAYSGVYAYLGQYFDQAYQIDTNGVVTTNSAGVLSSYGFFFPTNPGPAALVTMPDPDTGERGTDTVYAISVNVDANHDGIMDLSFGGPDNTSSSQPFNLWINDNYDRWLYDADDNTNYQDDLGPVDVSQLPLYQQVPDCDYVDGSGNPAIPDTRDLEDYFRLWTPGLSTLMKVLPANYTVQLTLSGDGQIRIFQAIEPDGGTNYLFDETTASNQVANSTALYVGLLTSSSPIVFNVSTNFNEHFIFCGTQAGGAQIDLQILDPNQNVVADAPAYLQINEIKEMYERWTVGEQPGQPPKTVPQPAVDGVTTAFQYTPPQDTNTPYILFVHGWNLETWEKDRFAETAFKRLYWQGYQGRFGEFRWPTGYGFNGWGTIATNLSEKDNFDNSEYQAWQSAVGLTNLLTQLNAEYLGQVYMLAHSMGNVVASEALRLAGNNQLVNTYVASQAAISAHTYDTNIADYSFYYPPWSYSADTPNIYGNWFAGNGGAAETIVYFYNTNDYALQRSVWQLDELLKPDQFVLEGSTHWYYGYSGSVSDPPPWNNFYKETLGGGTVVNFDIVNNLTNRYEVMGYAAQSWTTALGATPGITNLFNLNLPTVWPSPDPLGKNYASHFYHSAEFRGDTVWEWNYWHTLLSSPTLGFNINNP